MVSPRTLLALPDIPGFCRLTQSLAMLDAISCPDWDGRYYSFDSAWDDGERVASMRNGSGDQWFALLTESGVALHGLALDSPMYQVDSPWPGIFDSLPEEFRANFLEEPAFDTANSTFCLWRRTGEMVWSSGKIDPPPGVDPDGSARLLSLLLGGPERYVRFAAGYYERKIDLADVAAIYGHAPLTDALVKRLNPNLDVEAVAGDMVEIGYPD